MAIVLNKRVVDHDRAACWIMSSVLRTTSSDLKSRAREELPD